MVSFSVIIASYNKKEQLKKVINSLIPRLKRDDQLVIIDDGSNDGSQDYIQNLDILLDYDFYFLEDRGYRLSTVRNKGISLASNDIIIQLDDDYLMTGKIISKARELYDRDRLIVIRRDETDKNGNIVRDKRMGPTWKKWKIGKNLYQLGATGSPPAVYAAWGMFIYNKNVMVDEIGGYDERMDGLWGGEDCLVASKFHYHDYNVLYYVGGKCVHLSHVKRKDRFKEQQNNVEKMKKFLREYRKGM